MTDQPDWVTNTPSTEAIHNDPNASDFGFTSFFTPAMLFQIGTRLIEGVIKRVVEAIVGIFIPGGGSAFAQLQNWATALLPAQILAPLQSLVDLLVAFLGPIPIVGTIVEQLAAMFGLMNDNTTEAQGSANTANAGVSDIKTLLDAGTSGDSISDSFGRPANNTSGGMGSDWTQAYGSGAGNWGTNDGVLHWFKAGSSDREITALYTAKTLGADRQVIRVVFEDRLYRPSSNFPTLALCLRSDAGFDNYVCAVIQYNSVEIGYVLSGSYTRLGSASSISTKTGDLFEFYVGSASDDYDFELFQNGGSKCAQTDSGHSSLKGFATYKYVGVTGHVGLDNTFGVLAQVFPDIKNITASTIGV